MSNPNSRPTELQSINYGHFGTPVYNPVSKQWTFSKFTQPTGITTVLSQLNNGLPESDEFAPPTGNPGKETYLRTDTDDREERYDRALESELRQLIDTFPELQPAEATIKPLVRLSEGIAHAIDDYDPSVGNLVSAGIVTRTLEHGKETVKLVALPGGTCGEALRLIRLHVQEYSTNDAVFELHRPSSETGWWTGKGAPIQQICFSHSIERENSNSLLAVRLQGCVVVMFPRFRERPVPASGLLALDPPPKASQIDANILFEVSPNQAQGVTFAHVAFNPWDRREFAVIDQAGQWTIFRIARQSQESPKYEPVLLGMGTMPVVKESDGEQESEQEQEQIEQPTVEETEEMSVKGNGTAEEPREPSVDYGIPKLKIENRPSASKKSSVSLQDVPSMAGVPTDTEMATEEANEDAPDEESEEEEKEIELRQDGWARVIWILDQQTLVACTRRQIYLIDLATGEPFDFPPLLSADKYVPGWHLDMHLCSKHSDHIFVLTSQAIFLVSVSEVRNLNHESGRERQLRGCIIVSTFHFRDMADVSLRMCVSEEEQGYLVTIYSQYNKVATCFRFKISSDLEDRQVAVSDALPLILPNTWGARALSLEMERVQTGGSDAEGVEGLYNMQVLHRDLGLRRTFFEARACTDRNRARIPQRVGNVIGAKSADAFVTPDILAETVQEDESTSEEGDVESQMLIKPKHQPAPISQGGAIAAIEGTSNQGNDGAALPIPADIDTIAETLQSAVLNQSDKSGPQRTLFEHANQSIPQVADLRNASFALDDTFAAQTDETRVRMYPQILPMPVVEELRDDEIPLHNLHAYLEKNYIRPLDGGFTAAFRMQREEMVKSVAAEITLASAKVERLIKHEDEDGGAELDIDMDPDGLFVGTSQQTLASSMSFSQQSLPFSQPDEEREGRSTLPTPSATASHSRSRSPYHVPVNSAMDEILQRIRANASLEIKPTQSWSLKPMSILSHWELGQDPDTYSYTDTKKRLQEERVFIGMSDKERRRARRRRERDLVRRERERRKVEKGLGSSQAPTIVSSQLPGASQLPVVVGQSQPTVVASSQPIPSIRSSQQVPTIGGQRPPRGSQIPGFGSQLPTASRSQRAVPGFGSQSMQTPKPPRTKNVPGFGASQQVEKSSRSRSIPTSVQTSSQPSENNEKPGTDALSSQPVAGPSQASSIELPVRPTATPITVAEPSQTAPPNIDGRQMAFPSSQRPPLSSQRPASQRFSSQVSGSQTPRKKKKRTEGF